MKKTHYEPLKANETIRTMEDECIEMIRNTEGDPVSDTLIEFFWDFDINTAVFRHINRSYAF